MQTAEVERLHNAVFARAVVVVAQKHERLRKNFFGFPSPEDKAFSAHVAERQPVYELQIGLIGIVMYEQFAERCFHPFERAFLGVAVEVLEIQNERFRFVHGDKIAHGGQHAFERDAFERTVIYPVFSVRIGNAQIEVTRPRLEKLFRVAALRFGVIGDPARARVVRARRCDAVKRRIVFYHALPFGKRRIRLCIVVFAVRDDHENQHENQKERRDCAQNDQRYSSLFHIVTSHRYYIKHYIKRAQRLQ